jgi:NitT/TauT family transport system substrate-binding protein
MRWWGCFTLQLALVVTGTPLSAASAEVPEVVLGQQTGANYVPLMAMQHFKLIEKHLAAAGLPATRVSWIKLAGPAALTDAMLSGSTHFSAQGIPSLALLWDRTKSGIGVKGVGNICNGNLWLNTRRQDIRSLADFTEKDRIAVPSLKISGAAIYLQMAAEKVWGPGQHTRLDHLMVALSHPDAVAALLNPVHEINSHMATVPFHNAEINAGMKTVTTAYDIVGGEASTLAFTTYSTFRRDNPKTYEAVAAAFDEALTLVNADKRAAVRMYMEMTNERKQTEDEVYALVTAPDFAWNKTPRKVGATAEFMYRTGTLKSAPASWKDLFMPEVHTLAGD